MIYTLQTNNRAAAGTDTGATVSVPVRSELVQIEFVDATGVTADGTDYVTVTFSHGGTSLGTRNTNSGGSGTTITADTPETVSITGRPIIADGDVLKSDVANSGSGKAVALNTVWLLRAIP